MSPALLPESGDEGVTSCRRSCSPAAVGPGAAARALRHQPPTAEEVGRAAALCFRDTDSDEQIARQLGIVRRTLARWKKRTDFAAAMAALQAWQELAGEAAVSPGEDISRAGLGPEAASAGRRSPDDLH
jgi:hypothetical protein